MNYKLPFCCLLVALSAVIFTGISQAAGNKKTSFYDAGPGSGDLEIKSEKLEYDRHTGWWQASGNVVIRKGDQELRANKVRINRNTEVAEATGDVVLKKAGEVVSTGRSLRHNFKDKTGRIDNAVWKADPFYGASAEIRKKPDDTFAAYGNKVTTCTNKYPHCHYHLKSRKLSVVPGEHIKAYGSVLYLGRVPVMYMPYWYRNLKEDFGFRLYPGYGSRMGVFLLGSYRYRLNPVLKAETHLDYRTKRGVAVGQDLKWRHKKNGSGKLNLYYADDQNPDADHSDRENEDLENDRYRIRLTHDWNLSWKDYVLLKANYLSDIHILEDFFDKEYRKNVQPENYFSYTHREDSFTAGVYMGGRLNDFYSSVNRMPECSIDFVRQQLGESAFYYEGQAAAASLALVREKDSTDDEYSAFRLDSSHMVFRPTRYFGFLNVIPRCGYQGTYYSDIRDETMSVTNISQTMVTNTVVDSGGNTNTSISIAQSTNVSEVLVATRGADFRSKFEVGVETSFKAFKTWDDIGNGLRHVVEPYANYTYIPEPTLLAEDIHQFDDVDTLEEDHSIRFGVRNKYQTKLDNQPFDLVDVDIYTKYAIKRDSEEKAIQDVGFDAEFRVSDWLALDIDGVFDTDQSVMGEFNSQVFVYYEPWWSANVEHRYRYENSNLLFGYFTFYPNRNWAFSSYTRYELDNSRLEEQAGYIRRNFDCMTIRLGVGMIPGYSGDDGFERDNEWKFVVQFWLTALPDLSVSE
ncbi:LPS-assembly protein LptD [Verrucomicrobiota bacterium]